MMRRWGRWRLVQLGAFGLVVGLALPAGAALTPTWLAPDDVTTAGYSFQPQVADNQAGDAAAVWYRPDGSNFVIQGVVRPAGGPWGTPKDLSTASPNLDYPQVAVDAAGDAVAVWARGEGGTYFIQESSHPAGGSWSAAHDISVASSQASAPQVAIDPAGDVVAVWYRKSGSNTIIQAAVRPAGGAWVAPKDLSASGQDAGYPQVGLDAAGDAVAVWYRYDGSNYIVQAATRPAGGAWSAAENVSATGENGSFPQVAVDPAGDATAVWGGNTSIKGAVRKAGGDWSAPKDVSGSGDSATQQEVAIDPAGDAVAVFVHLEAGYNIVQAAAHPAGGVWQAPIDLSVTGQGAGDPQVALTPAGKALVVWSRSNGTSYIVQGATRPPGGAWGSPRDLSATGANSFGQQVAADGAGNALAVWERGETDRYIVQAAGYDAAGPVLVGLALPSKATAGFPLSFAVAPFDVWSPVAAQPAWSFGDGAKASGKAVKHTYAKAGHYTVTISDADTLGNSTSTTRQLAVAAPCVVPRVRGKRLTRARASLKRSHCRLGKLTHAYSRRVKKGLVIAERPKVGRKLPNGAKVSLVVSRGSRR